MLLVQAKFSPKSFNSKLTASIRYHVMCEDFTLLVQQVKKRRKRLILLMKRKILLKLRNKRNQKSWAVFELTDIADFLI